MNKKEITNLVFHYLGLPMTLVDLATEHKCVQTSHTHTKKISKFCLAIKEHDVICSFAKERK